jgi:hypothetical protein
MALVRSNARTAFQQIRKATRRPKLRSGSVAQAVPRPTGRGIATSSSRLAKRGSEQCVGYWRPRPLNGRASPGRLEAPRYAASARATAP